MNVPLQQLPAPRPSLATQISDVAFSAYLPRDQTFARHSWQDLSRLGTPRVK